MKYWEIKDYATDADIEEQINDEIPTISGTTAAIHFINKFLSIQKVTEERVLESFGIREK